MKLRNFGVILSLAIFLAAQALGIGHAAAYGPGKHKHHGLTCDISLSADQAKASPPPLAILPVPVCSSAAFVPPVVVAHYRAEYPEGIPRAPPVTLLS